jgi:UDP-N-acetyl-D-mannosaminuronic acid dehydrogenase
MGKYDICVIGGGGRVGLPLSIAFADKGKKVVIFDKNAKALETIGRGRMPFKEEGADAALSRVIHKKLFLSGSPDVVGDARFVIVVIGTPVDEHLNPAYRKTMEFFEELRPFLHKGQVVILRSTVYPGITKKVHEMLKARSVGVETCFCPERIAEGRAMEELFSLPQIVSGFHSPTVKKVAALFKLLTKDIIFLDPLEAELAKLFTNSWRYVQFAIANQFFMIAEEYGADFYSIFRAMTHNYPRTRNFPKPGFAAGPCLFKDTMQISAFTNNRFFLGHSAMLINEGLPNFIMGQLKQKCDLTRKTVGILGMAFKAESDDKRDSLSYKLRRLADLEAKTVLCSDVYIKEDGFVDEKTLIQESDVIIIGAPHKRYRTLNFKGKIVVDIWDHVSQPKRSRT